MVIMGEFHDFLSFHVLTQNSRSTDGHLLCFIAIAGEVILLECFARRGHRRLKTPWAPSLFYRDFERLRGRSFFWNVSLKGGIAV